MNLVFAPAATMRLVDGIAQLSIAATWLSFLADLAFVAITARTFADVVIGVTTPAAGVGAILVAAMVAGVVELVAFLILVVWMFNVSANLDAVAEATAGWRPAWAIAGWFIPLANLVIPPLVLADIARNSADEIGGAEGSRQVRRIWVWWWVCQVGGAPIAVLGYVGVVQVAAEIARAISFDPTTVLTVIAPAPAIVVAVMRAVLGARVIGGITREQRLRAQRLSVGTGVIGTGACAGHSPVAGASPGERGELHDGDLDIGAAGSGIRDGLASSPAQDRLP